jgi:hypothetical protein
MAEANPTGDEQTFGAQSLRFLEPTLAVGTFRDPLHAEDLFALVAVLRASLEQNGRMFLLADMRVVTEIPRHVRHFGEKALIRYSGLALIGASFPVRVATSMVIRAARLLDKDRFDFPLAFFKTEAEGLAWLRERAGA